MKFKILVIACLFISYFNTMAQDMAVLKIEALKAYKAGANMDYDVIFETTYPKVFDVIPKKDMKEMFENMMESEQFSIKMIEVDPKFSFGEIKKIENKLFCLIDHNSVMDMTFKEPLYEDTNMMLDIFKETMDAEKVSFDAKTNTFKIEMRATLIAISDEVTNYKWKFINKDKENRLFSLLFDDKMKTALGL